MLGIGTILSGIFGGWRIYAIVGAAVAAAALFGYVEHVRADAATSRAALSSANATINETTFVLDNANTQIAKLQASNAANEAALVWSQETQAKVAQALSAAQEKVNVIPVPKDCQGLDARDRAALDGVRGIIGYAAGSHPSGKASHR